MNTTLHIANPAEIETELLAVFAADTGTSKEKDARPEPVLLTPSAKLREAAANSLALGDFKASLNETLLLTLPAGLKVKRLLIVGLGKAAKITPHDLRKAAGTAVRFAKPRQLHHMAILLPASDALPAAASARAAVEGAFMGDFDPDTYRSDRKDQSIHELMILAQTAADKAAVENGFAEGLVLGESQSFTRSLVNEPGNKLTPTIFGERAAAMAKEVGLKAEVYGAEKLHE